MLLELRLDTGAESSQAQPRRPLYATDAVRRRLGGAGREAEEAGAGGVPTRLSDSDRVPPSAPVAKLAIVPWRRPKPVKAEAAPELLAAPIPGESPNAPYLEILRVSATHFPSIGEETPAEGRHVELDIGDSLPVGLVAADIEEALLKAGFSFEVETRVRRAHVGAYGSGAEIIFIIFGAGAGVAFQEAWTIIKERVRARARSTLELDAEWRRPVEMAAQLLSCREQDLHFLEGAGGADGTAIEVERRGTGERYRLTTAGDEFVLERVAGDIGR